MRESPIIRQFLAVLVCFKLRFSVFVSGFSPMNLLFRVWGVSWQRGWNLFVVGIVGTTFGMLVLTSMESMWGEDDVARAHNVSVAVARTESSSEWFPGESWAVVGVNCVTLSEFV